jgi:hypothetical protein
MVQTPKEFEICDKHALARSIWITKRNELVGLRLVCKLAIDYSLYDYQLWNNVLEALYQKKDCEYLLEVLLSISSSAQFSTFYCIPEIFQGVLLQCCEKWLAEKELGLDTVPQFLEYIHIGSRSHYMKEDFGLQLEDLISNWLVNGPFDSMRFLIGFYCLTKIVPNTLIFEPIYESMCAKDCIAVLETLQSAESRAIILSEIKNRIHVSIFDMINKKQYYSSIATTSYMAPFVKYLAKTHNIHKLVNASVSLQRYEDALKLLHVYFSIHDPGSDYSDKETILKFEKKFPVEGLEDWISFVENEFE